MTNSFILYNNRNFTTKVGIFPFHKNQKWYLLTNNKKDRHTHVPPIMSEGFRTLSSRELQVNTSGWDIIMVNLVHV